MTLEYIEKLSSPQRKNSFNDSFCIEKFYRNSYKTLSSEESQKSNWTKCREFNLHYTTKIHKNNSLQHRKSKTMETKICKGVDGVGKFTVKSTKNA